MIIKRRPVISWLLSPLDKIAPKDIVLSSVRNPISAYCLNKDFVSLDSIRMQHPNWGFPELLMPSFVEVMKKSYESFKKIRPRLFHEFCELKECGVLLWGNLSFVYKFSDDKLHLWSFLERKYESVFCFYSCNEFIDNLLRIGISANLIRDDFVFEGTLELRKDKIGEIVNFVVAYVIVKKHGKVETIVIPQGNFTAIEGTPLEYVERKKVVNMIGQQVIVMDSKWFRKIINDNDVFVRGHWRMQNKKNDVGEWYKELIFIENFVRHGYHRNAKIER